ncbi:MAG TPA: phage portal protein [Clostridiales bacterium]|nr:phage portal protein [Clostridiales bacterium]
MGLKDIFLSWFGKDGTLKLDAYVGKLATEVYFKELAIQACINLIANTISRSEFKTYEKGKETKKDNYYLFNVEPNPNKSASKFWRDVIHHLVYDNECLVVQQGDYFYVADSFNVDKYAFKDYIYTNIVIDDYQLNKTYFEPDVFHFELHNEKIRIIINGLYESYAKLIAAAQKHYKKQNARRGKLIVPTDYPQTDEAQKELQKLLNERFKRFFEAEGDAIVPLTNGLEYEELENKANGNKGSMEGRDIRAFIDDIFDFVAIAFQVPPQLLKGNVADTDKAVNNFLTFCINPLAELLTDEINRKMYGKKNYLERTYMKLDTSNIRAVDIKDVAGALDILLRIGAYSVDDCLKYLGMEPLETEWSKARWMTKNYEPIETRFEGGDNGEK